MGVVNGDYLYLSGLFLLSISTICLCPNELTVWMKEGKRCIYVEKDVEMIFFDVESPKGVLL